MKCDELKSRTAYSIAMEEEYLESSGTTLVYIKADVDATIAELYDFAENACLERDDYQNVIDELQAENRRLRRLLWHAIALFCARSCEYFNGIMSHCLMGQDDLYKRCEEKKNKYLHAMYKCRAKAEEYK